MKHKKYKNRKVTKLVETIMDNLLLSLEAQTNERTLDPKEAWIIKVMVITNMAGFLAWCLESEFNISQDETLSQIIDSYEAFKKRGKQ